MHEPRLARLGIESLVERATAAGLVVIRFPIRGVSVPTGSVCDLLQQIRLFAEAGKNVAVHCEGGLGRASTIGGCYLAQFGHTASNILENIRVSRGSSRCRRRRTSVSLFAIFAHVYDRGPAFLGPWRRSL